MNTRCWSILWIFLTVVVALQLGCVSRTCVERSFLRDLQANPTVDGWAQYSAELQYYVSKDDPEANRIARQVLIAVNRRDVVYPEADFLAWSVYENQELNGIERLPVDDQVTLLRMYDRVLPTDWISTREEYLVKHPDVEKVDKMWTEAAAHGRAYQASGQYSDLMWLAEKFFVPGLSRKAVEDIVGPGDDCTMESDHDRQYDSHGPTDGSILIVHYQNGVLGSWEWASE